MLITSTPRAFSRRARSTAASVWNPRGGGSSTASTKCLSDSAWARRDFRSRATGGLLIALSTRVRLGALAAGAVARTTAGARPRTAVFIWRMCSGVVPQQPPTTRTLCRMNRRA
jgi:hypothetical protein